MASIFSKIVAGEIPCHKVAESEKFFAFLDINPLTKGHTLVIPKKEVNYIFDLDEETYSGLFLFAKKIAEAIKQSVNCQRVGIAVIGMEVPHTHIHLIPMQSEGDMVISKPKLKLSPEEMQKIAEKIAKNMG
ncbi:MAG: HIT family protein [Prevotellaceae bacterium]|jgi:histidine triad (HIT) family protein|nr:HIT family protein [Prevotellaceae bacterium]